MLTEYKGHKQVIIKVNAECDEGIVPIVLALNQIEGVITLDSCQCGIYKEAYVFFTYGETWQKTGCLANELASCLRENGICCECIIMLEWVGSNDRPRAKLVCNSRHVDGVADIINSSAARITTHMLELIHGM
jgi:hypothetical protein